MDKPKGSSPDSRPDAPNPQTPSLAVKTPNPQAPSWREVAAMAAKESDPIRLAQLVDELIRLLDEERRGKGLRPFEKE